MVLANPDQWPRSNLPCAASGGHKTLAAPNQVFYLGVCSIVWLASNCLAHRQRCCDRTIGRHAGDGTVVQTHCWALFCDAEIVSIHTSMLPIIHWWRRQVLALIWKHKSKGVRSCFHYGNCESRLPHLFRDGLWTDAGQCVRWGRERPIPQGCQ